MKPSHYSIKADLARKYGSPKPVPGPVRVESAGDGFVAEVAGKLILTAPARSLTNAVDLPVDMRQRWETASVSNPYMQWLQGRFVEAEKANLNGAFWTTADLQFGEMSVKHGPLNWLHEGRKVVGTIADNALITPVATAYANVAGDATNILTQASITGTFGMTAPRPYIAAVSAVWKWLYPEEAKVIAKASDEGSLYYSMECVAQQMQCVETAGAGGCGKSFDYITAMTKPAETCEHIASRSGVRRMVSPSFLGGAIIVPPARPGWGQANAEVMKQAAGLAEQVAPANADTSHWELLMAAVLANAVT